MSKLSWVHIGRCRPKINDVAVLCWLQNVLKLIYYYNNLTLLAQWSHILLGLILFDFIVNLQSLKSQRKVWNIATKWRRIDYDEKPCRELKWIREILSNTEKNVHVESLQMSQNWIYTLTYKGFNNYFNLYVNFDHIFK